MQQKTKIAFILAGIVASSSAASSATAATITNGSFESGLSGWTTSGNVQTVSNIGKLSESGTFAPTHGSSFAYLLAGSTGVYTLTSQQFTASAADKLTLDVFFDANDYFPYNDDGYVRLIDTTTSLATTLFSASVTTVGDYGSTPWTGVSYTFAAAGTYRLEFGVENVQDNGFESALGVDHVAINGISNAAPVAPLPGAMIGGTALFGRLILRRQRA